MVFFKKYIYNGYGSYQSHILSFFWKVDNVSQNFLT